MKKIKQIALILLIVIIVMIPIIIEIMKVDKKEIFIKNLELLVKAYADMNSEMSRMDITDDKFPFKEHSFIDGTVMTINKNEVEVYYVTDGNYCASGSLEKLEVTEGHCEKNPIDDLVMQTCILNSNPNGGEWNTSKESQNVKLLNEKETYLSNPERDDYTFTGWNIKISGNIYNEEDGFLTTNLTAVWNSSNDGISNEDKNSNVANLEEIFKNNSDDITINKYLLTVNPNDGKWNDKEETSEFIIGNNSEIDLVNPIKEGYKFNGWNVKVVGNIDDKENGSLTIELVASYEPNIYTLTIDSNEGIYEKETKVEIKMDDTYELAIPTKEGYVFAGWEIDNDKSQISENNIFTMGSSNTKITAKWNKLYNLTINLDGGTGIQKLNYQMVNGEKLHLQTPTKEDFLFYKWEVNGLGSIVENNSFIMGSEDTTLVAKWSEFGYDLSVDVNGGKLIQDIPSRLAPMETLILNIPTKIGYKFKNWIVIGDGSKVDGNTFTMGTEATKITASYEPINYSLSYNLNGGSSTNKTSYTIESNTFNLINPTREGYTFKGWTGSNGETPSLNVTINRGTIGNKIYYAKWDINSYTLTANANSGSITSTTGWTGTGDTLTKSLSYNETYGILPTVSRIGYDFKGWYTKLNEGEIVTPTTKIGASNTNIYAQWTPTTYTIGYTLNGGSATNKTSYTIENETFELINPSKEGYIFKGWTGSNGETPNLNVTISKGSTGNKECTANWEVESYSITYNLNSGTQESGATTSYTVETETFNLPTPTKEGYTFDGWYEESDFSGTEVTKITKGTTGNKIYYAKWDSNSYTLTANANSGSITTTTGWSGTGDTSTKSLNYNASYGTLPNVSRIGYDFKGWYTKTNEGEIVTPTTKIGASNTNIYAQWTPITYTIGYTLNGGSATNVESYTIENETFELINPSKEGYIFKGWTGSNGETPSLNVTINKGTIGNKEYTANWEVESYSITYNLNSGTQESGATTSYTVETETFNLPNPIKSGYTFDGWYEESDFSGTEVTKITKGTTGNKTYYAKWKITNYSITYNLNGGINEDNVVTSYTIETETFSLPIPIKTENTFLGWYASSDFTGEVVAEITKGTTENKIYYAKWGSNSYTLTANANSGSITTTIGWNGTGDTSTKSLSYNETYGILPTVSRIGYDFKGWYTKPNEGEIVTPTTKIDASNTNIYAQWTPITYAIGYTLNGGSATNVESYTIENETFELTNPTKEGYIFKGWTGSNGETPSLNVTINKGTTGNKEYTANWEVESYSITYNLNSGTQESGATTSYTVETETFNLPNPIKSGYTFDGWYEESDFSGDRVTEIIKGTTGDKTYYAKWGSNSYILTANANSGSITTTTGWSGTGSTATKTLNYNAAYSTLPNISRTGYDLKGWYTTASGGSQVSETTKIGASNTSIYAQWNPISYSISYNLNDGSSPYSTNYTVETNTFNLINPTREGYIFKGWTGSNGETPSLNVTINKGTTGNKEYTANWEVESYSITYNLNSGTQESGATTSYTVETETFSLPTPTRAGYTFGGWYENSSFSGSNVTQIAKGSTGDKTYYAKWTINSYTLTANANGGSITSTTGWTGTGSTSTKSLNYNAAYSTLPNISRTGYTLKGWYTAASGGSQVSTTTKIGAGNANIFAQWNVVNYSITYNLNSGTQGSGAKTSYNIETATFSLPTPTRTGYTFGGWYTNSSLSGSSVSQISKGTTGNKTYYAKWTANTYTIKYDCNGGGGSTSDSSHTYGTAKALSTNGCTSTIKTGTSGMVYYLSGWSKSNTATSATYTPGQSVTNVATSGTVTLYAVWSPVFSYNGSYNVINDGNGNWRVKFLSSGTYTSNLTVAIDVFLVGGGSSFGGSGYTTTVKNINTYTNYITVGVGGTPGNDGTASTAFNQTANPGNGCNGGSGCGASAYTAEGLAGASDGASATGTVQGATGGTGQGTTTREFGESGGTLYAGGGGGGGGYNSGDNRYGGLGGDGGGGCGYYERVSGCNHNGADNTGGGAGLGQRGAANYYGGSGIVVIRNKR